MNHMTAIQGISERISHVFISATLLTRSVERAEAAVLTGITQLHQDCRSQEELLQRTASAALAIEDTNNCPAEEEVTRASFALPTELQHVLRLPQKLRLCFVLRLLNGFSRERCAGLLHLASAEVDRFTSLAVQALAGVADPCDIQPADNSFVVSRVTPIWVAEDPIMA